MGIICTTLNMDQTTQYIDLESFENLFQSYGPKVYAVCMYHIRDRETARDLVQDIFKSLWERKDDIQIHCSIEHYLLRCAKLKVLEYFRKETTRRKNMQLVYIDFREEDDCTLSRIEMKDLLGHTREELQLMPAKTNKIFFLSREQGLTNKEIAADIQSSEKTVEYHIKKASEFIAANSRIQEYRTGLRDT